MTRLAAPLSFSVEELKYLDLTIATLNSARATLDTDDRSLIFQTSPNITQSSSGSLGRPLPQRQLISFLGQDRAVGTLTSPPSVVP